MHEIPHSRPWILPEDHAAVCSALQDRRVSCWSGAKELAHSLVDYSKGESCRLYATGTLALRAALCSLSLAPCSRIAIPAFTCVDVAQAVIAAGFVPVVLDCSENGNISKSAIITAYESGDIDAVVVTHQFGVVDETLSEVCRFLPTIEDCSHVPPRRHFPGSMFIAGSMEGTKLLGIGEGGYLIGFERPVSEAPSAILGARMSDLLATIGLQQVCRLPDNIACRERIANAYIGAVGSQHVIDGTRSAWYRFLLCLSNEEAVSRVISQAAEVGIVLRRPIMPTTLDCLLDQNKSFVANQLWRCTVSVPLYPALLDDEIERIVQFLKSLA